VEIIKIKRHIRLRVWREIRLKERCVIMRVAISLLVYQNTTPTTTTKYTVGYTEFVFLLLWAVRNPNTFLHNRPVHNTFSCFCVNKIEFVRLCKVICINDWMWSVYLSIFVLLPLTKGKLWILSMLKSSTTAVNVKGDESET